MYLLKNDIIKSTFPLPTDNFKSTNYIVSKLRFLSGYKVLLESLGFLPWKLEYLHITSSKTGQKNT